MSSPKSSARDRRGAKAREEMRAKGYIQTFELAEKLTVDLGKKVTISMLRSHSARGRIQSVLHKESNILFYPADTKLPHSLIGKKDENRKQRQGQGREEPVVLEGPLVNWQAPGFVRMAGRSFQVGEPITI